jgi:hypothetical protein
VAIRPFSFLARDRGTAAVVVGSLTGVVDHPSEPDTVTEAVELLQAEGYTSDVMVGPNTFTCPACGQASPLADAHVDKVFRFEGESDPADEMIVIGLSCPACGQRGLLVSAFGPDADPEHAEALRSLAGHGPA